MTDVLVAGAGVAGLTVAWRAAQRGLSVTVVDEAPGTGASYAAAGMLAPVAEAAYGEEALVALSRNERLVRMTAGVWNEMRLVFHVVGEPAAFHGSYLARNHAIAATLAAGDPEAAAAALATYLDDAEEHTLATWRQRSLGEA